MVYGTSRLKKQYPIAMLIQTLKYSGEAAECTGSSMELDEVTASTLNSAEVSNR